METLRQCRAAVMWLQKKKKERKNNTKKTKNAHPGPTIETGERHSLMRRRFIRQVVRLREFNRWSFGGGGQLDVSEEVLARAAAPRITSRAVEDIDLLKPPPPQIDLSIAQDYDSVLLPLKLNRHRPRWRFCSACDRTKDGNVNSSPRLLLFLGAERLEMS